MSLSSTFIRQTDRHTWEWHKTGKMVSRQLF